MSRGRFGGGAGTRAPGRDVLRSPGGATPCWPGPPLAGDTCWPGPPLAGDTCWPGLPLAGDTCWPGPVGRLLSALDRAGDRASW